MDGTGGNVKIKWKATSGASVLEGLTAGGAAEHEMYVPLRLPRQKDYSPAMLFAMPAAIGTSNFSCWNAFTISRIHRTNATRLIRLYSIAPKPNAPYPPVIHHPRSEDNPQRDINDVQPAKHDHRLRGVKSHKRPLVDQEEDQPGDPSQQIAQENQLRSRTSRAALSAPRLGATAASSRLAARRIWDRSPLRPPLHFRTCCKRPWCCSPLEGAMESAT